MLRSQTKSLTNFNGYATSVNSKVSGLYSHENGSLLDLASAIWLDFLLERLNNSVICQRVVP
jgi:hypothetical protein